MPCKIVGGTKVPGNEKSRERKFLIGTIRSWERKVLGTKSPGTHGVAREHGLHRSFNATLVFVPCQVLIEPVPCMHWQ